MSDQDAKFAGTPFVSDEQVRYVDGYRNGYEMGASDRAAGAEAILMDLIAELRNESEAWVPSVPVSTCRAMADRAEARLRELDTPPNSANDQLNLGGAR